MGGHLGRLAFHGWSRRLSQRLAGGEARPSATWSFPGGAPSARRSAPASASRSARPAASELLDARPRRCSGPRAPAAPCPSDRSPTSRRAARSVGAARWASTRRSRWAITRATGGRLCLQLKREREAWLAPWLAGLLADARATELALLPADAWVVPVPLHWLRRLQRGYNQSDALAESPGRPARPGNPSARSAGSSTPNTWSGTSLAKRAEIVPRGLRVDARRAPT